MLFYLVMNPNSLTMGLLIVITATTSPKKFSLDSTYSHSVISVNVWCGIVEKYITTFLNEKIVMKVALS
jgi:hypothetical protein